jgi:hypothetical protein
LRKTTPQTRKHHGNPLQHPGNAHGGEVERREKGQKQAQAKQDEAPPGDAPDGRRVVPGLVAQRTQGVRNGHPDDEQEKREHQVGGRAAIPLGVPQGGVHVAPTARVVHQDHGGHGDAAEHVQRQQPGPGRAGRRHNEGLGALFDHQKGEKGAGNAPCRTCAKACAGCQLGKGIRPRLYA